MSSNNKSEAAAATTTMSSSTATTTTPPIGGPMLCYAMRMPAGADLVPTLKNFAGQCMMMKQQQATSCFVMTAVGSLTYAKLRLANADRHSNNEVKEYHERFEVVSLVGTLNTCDDNDNVGMHIHMSIADKDGLVVGGHLMDATIFTTLEIVVGIMPTVNFSREHDPATGFPELVVRKKQADITAPSDGALADEEAPDKKKRAREESQQSGCN